MLAVDFGPCRELGLIFGLKALLAIPPGAAAIEIISNVRGTDNGHLLTTEFRLRKVTKCRKSKVTRQARGKYSTNFLISPSILALRLSL